MALIDLDNEFLEMFFSITNANPPSQVDLLALKKQLIEIVEIFRELNANAKKPIFSKALGMAPEEENEQNGPAILVVDGLLGAKILGFDIDISKIFELLNRIDLNSLGLSL